jgi:hypothetical protein
MTPAQARTLVAIEEELARLIRYDDESLVHAAWIRQRYDGGLAASYAPARAEAARTAWHEAGHAVAALAIGARFSSISIRAGSASAGRVHRIQGSAIHDSSIQGSAIQTIQNSAAQNSAAQNSAAQNSATHSAGGRRGDLAFVIDAAGQVAERLRDWTLPAHDDDVAAFLARWRGDGGDARRFRAAITGRFAGNEAAAWHYSVQVLTPLRPRIARLARGLLVHPRHLPYPVAAAIAGLPTTVTP